MKTSPPWYNSTPKLSVIAATLFGTLIYVADHENEMIMASTQTMAKIHSDTMIDSENGILVDVPTPDFLYNDVGLLSFHLVTASHGENFSGADVYCIAETQGYRIPFTLSAIAATYGECSTSQIRIQRVPEQMPYEFFP